ncbi:DHA2 family efflux MFS transporter permease subunit [Cereibacter sphaeroides]|uniref:DHA2 family efflux MFS transporter permease subunit n=1 Tax=Cereibacter sphaeroides TaxID=1063 RepID=UPI001F24CC3E|nr:DHA2 family efflux MFS transporter permease subunit [Cereibacter sphaeroides]MCE6961329.1 DHA2 family efflux MFS transporter permease subunit [Cereibacter sphaeroides]MCE6970315.1 DHA2 family efflux MFS transporter permease subunit [Cereibacter sphaeroides]MCE6972057.1 DHA2 family efflux MFS transporter permease subunit [Cereibacter sphaeroides]
MTPPPKPPVEHRGLITAMIMLATIMQVLDTTIANVALPSMTGDLDASADTINWVLTSYIVAAAIMTPVTGWLADRIGKRELFLASIVGFTLASMACGMAWSLPSMVGFRLLQGIFGAAIVPLSQTFLLDINPREKAGQAMAVWGAGIMVGPIIGPTLGGWLTESWNWRWVFFINLPLGIVAFLGCVAWLPRAGRVIRRFDFFGFAMLAIALGSLQLMLDRGAEVEWFAALETWIYLFLMLTGFWVFVIHILSTDKPFLEPAMFADRNFATGLVFIFVVGIILLASLALLPPMLSHIFGYPVITTGMVMAPRGIGTMIAMLLAGRLLRLVDARILVTMGLSLTAVSLHMMTGFSPQMDSTPIVLSGVVQGLGLGLVFVPLSTVAFATIEPRFRADATSLFSLVRNIGSSVGISMVTVMLTHNTQINHAELGAHVSAGNPQLWQLSPEAAQGAALPLSVIDRVVTQQAAMIAYVDDFRLMMLITLAALPLGLLLRRPQASASAAVAAD